MRRLITIGALTLALAVVSGCTREDPRASRENLLEHERSRNAATLGNAAQMAVLRDRLRGQSQR